jgi:hypothetical protein
MTGDPDGPCGSQTFDPHFIGRPVRRQWDLGPRARLRLTGPFAKPYIDVKPQPC